MTWFLVAFGISQVTMAVTPESVTEAFSRYLAEAKTPDAVARAQKSYELLRLAQEACRIQREKHHLPVSCYEALHLEQRWQLRSADEFRAQQDRLDQLCTRAVQDYKFPDKTVASTYLSPKCQQDVMMAKRIQDYRRISDNWSEN